MGVRPSWREAPAKLPTALAATKTATESVSITIFDIQASHFGPLPHVLALH